MYYIKVKNTSFDITSYPLNFLVCQIPNHKHLSFYYRNTLIYFSFYCQVIELRNIVALGVINISLTETKKTFKIDESYNNAIEDFPVPKVIVHRT